MFAACCALAATFWFPLQDQNHGIQNEFPAWSPDGAKIYFQSSRDGGREQLYIMDADGSHQRQITHNNHFSGVPLISPDGRRILFMINEAASPERQHWQIYVMDAGGFHQKNLSNNAWNDQVPRWSADGRRILFFSDRPGADGQGKNQIYVMNADGHTRRSNYARQLRQSHGRVVARRKTHRLHLESPRFLGNLCHKRRRHGHRAKDAHCSGLPVTTMVARRLPNPIQPIRRSRK
jgi:dipeptidyl aminopeptidase/acylaminoacyl peptidase